MQRLVFFDVDGTLISFTDRSISKQSLASLQALRQAGHKVGLATGRTPRECHFLDGVFDFDLYITMNGQYCYDKERQVFHDRPLPKKDLEAIVDFSERHGLACYFAEVERLYVNRYTPEIERILDIVEQPKPPVWTPEQIKAGKVYQMAMALTEEQEAKMAKVLAGLSIVRWHQDFVDVIPQGGGKENGVKAGLERLGMPWEASIVFGDGGNDISMIQYAKLGIAMGNASKAVKEAAQLIAPSIEEEGVTQMLKQLQLIP